VNSCRTDDAQRGGQQAEAGGGQLVDGLGVGRHVAEDATAGKLRPRRRRQEEDLPGKTAKPSTGETSLLGSCSQNHAYR